MIEDNVCRFCINCYAKCTDLDEEVIICDLKEDIINSLNDNNKGNCYAKWDIINSLNDNNKGRC